MKNNLYKTQTVDIDFINKSNVFIELNSTDWPVPLKVSLEQLFPTNLSLDEKTLEVTPQFLITQGVFAEKFIDQHISYKQPPIDSSSITGIHLSTDGLYLYVWTGDKWKRAILSEYY